jgi:hypothetical protein
MSGQYDYGQPPPQGEPGAEERYGPIGSSGKAVASLILGLGSFCTTCCTGIPAIILGFMGLSDIRRSNGRLGGSGMAVVGIITGFLGTFCGVGCLGIGLFGLNMLNEMARAELNRNPVVQEHLGELTSCAINWTATIEERDRQRDRPRQNEIWVFDVEGTKGSGIARTRMVQVGDKFRLEAGTLELSDGRLIDLVPEKQ